MKVFIPLLGLMAIVSAEPPVGDGYPSSRSHQHDHHHDSSHSSEHVNQRNSPSQEYGVPSSRSFGLSQTYGPPDARNSEISQEYGVPSARSALSQEYGVPGLRSGGPSQEYGLPGLANGIPQDFTVPEQGNTESRGFDNQVQHGQDSYSVTAQRSTPSSVYGPPEQRSLSQEYGVPGQRNFGLSQEYGTPEFHSSSDHNDGSSFTSSEHQNSLRSGLSQEYGVPGVRSNGLSRSYLPAARSTYARPAATVSRSFGSFSLRSSSTTSSPALFRSALPSATPSDSFSTGYPLSRTSDSHSGYASARTSASTYPSARTSASQSSSGYPSARSSPSQSNFSFNSARTTAHSANGYPSRNSGSHASSSFATARSSASHSAGYPSSRISDSHTSSPNARNFGVQQQHSQALVTPKSLSQEYGVPPKSSNLNTNAFASSFASGRTPSPVYGSPNTRSGANSADSYSSAGAQARSQGMPPSEQYGVPEQFGSQSGRGYDYSRNNLDDLLNQEPANYDFSYKVNDYESGSDFGHSETRLENRAEGSYFVVLPDGTKQIVEYEADEDGFKPRISIEPADASTRAGYDENAQDQQARSGGPY